MISNKRLGTDPPNWVNRIQRTRERKQQEKRLDKNKRTKSYMTVTKLDNNAIKKEKEKKTNSNP